MRTTEDGRGVISLLEIADVMDRPRLFSTFMLWMLAQLYATLPEVGDLPKPKLAFFFDEAHLLFDDASEALIEQIELHGAADPLEGRRRVLRDAVADRRAVVRAVAARQPRAACPARIHARRRREPSQDREDVPDHGPLRRRGDPHLPRDRRGLHHRADAERRADAARGDAARAARFDDGRGRRGDPRRADRRGALRERYATPVDRESAHEILTGKLHGAAETATTSSPPLPPAAARSAEGRRGRNAKASSEDEGAAEDPARSRRRRRSRSATRPRTSASGSRRICSPRPTGGARCARCSGRSSARSRAR